MISFAVPLFFGQPNRFQSKCLSSVYLFLSLFFLSRWCSYIFWLPFYCWPAGQPTHSSLVHPVTDRVWARVTAPTVPAITHIRGTGMVWVKVTRTIDTVTDIVDTTICTATTTTECRNTMDIVSNHTAVASEDMVQASEDTILSAEVGGNWSSASRVLAVFICSPDSIISLFFLSDKQHTHSSSTRQSPKPNLHYRTFAEMFAFPHPIEPKKSFQIDESPTLWKPSFSVWSHYSSWIWLNELASAIFVARQSTV